MYSVSAIRKLLLEVFERDDFESDGSGLAAPNEGRVAWITSLVKRLKAIDLVACYPYWQLLEDSKYAAIRFTISPPESNLSDEKQASQKSEAFLLTVDCRVFVHLKSVKTRRGGKRNYIDVSLSNGQREGLWIVDCVPKRCDFDTAAPVTRIAQIEELIDRIKANQEQASLKHTRKLKVTGFRQHGLKSRLKELGNEHGFSFCVGYNARDVNLSLRIIGPRTKQQIEYHLAFSQGKFDDVLNEIPDLIRRLQTLADLGIAFHTDNKKWSPIQSDWIRFLSKPIASKQTLFPMD